MGPLLLIAFLALCVVAALFLTLITVLERRHVWFPRSTRAAFVGLFVLAFGGVAYAATTVPVKAPTWFSGGVFVNSAKNATSTATANKVTKMLGASSTYDPASITATCTESSAITVTGAAVGDPCSVGVPAANGALNVSHTCYVSAADAVKVKVCNPTAGAIDGASGTFYVRVVSSQ